MPNRPRSWMDLFVPCTDSGSHRDVSARIRASFSSIPGRSWKKSVGFQDVLGISRPAVADVLLEQGYPGDLEQQEGDDQRAGDRPPRARRQGDQEESPPDAELAEVVRVAGVAPQA